MDSRPSPALHAARLREDLPSPLLLVLDTNVWLDVRRSLGWDRNGLLGDVTESSLEEPAVALVRSESVLGRPVRIVIDDVIRGELFDKLRTGHDGWFGCTDPRDAARMLTELVQTAVPR